MKKHTKLLCFALLLILAGACKNEYDSIGVDLKDRDLLGNAFSNTSSIIAYSILDDSANTIGLNQRLLGEIHDPVFGKTQPNFYTQFMLESNSVDFGNAPVLDSIILTLAISGYYGDTNSDLSIKVYELDESLESGKEYYSNQSINTLTTNLAHNPSFSCKPMPNTKITIDTSVYEPHIRVRLSNSLGQRFLDNSDKLAGNSEFQNFFKGVHIVATTTSSTGCLVYINLNSALSAVNLHYHNSDKAKLKFTFNTAKGVCFSNFTHDYNTSSNHNFKEQVLNNNQELGKEALYIQPLLGVKTFIKFPDLHSTFKDQKVTLNKAELVISNISPDELHFIQPGDLSLQMIKKDGIDYLPDDSYYTGAAYFGGVYNATTKEYRFRITRYVQTLMSSDKNDMGLYLVTKGAGVRGNRLILGGTNSINPDKNLRLDLYYTTY